MQKDYYKRYGTTMRGLMAEHGLKPDDFLEFVHQIDHSPLLPNPTLGAAIEALPGRKLILTNGTRKHADAVMRRLDIHHCISRMCSTSPPPISIPSRCRRSMTAFCASTASIRPSPRCSRTWRAISRCRYELGMTTVLVVPPATREVFREGWELEGRDAAHVDHVTDDLAEFLKSLAGAGS